MISDDQPAQQIQPEAAVTSPPSSKPTWIRCQEFLLDQIPAQATILDVGCGDGGLLRKLGAQGYQATGIEVVPELVTTATVSGLNVQLGQAESLPLPNRSIDVVVCSVVLPYTDERRAVAEWARVLRPGGMVNMTGHGLGYGFDFLLRKQAAKRRFYGLRMLVNSGFYWLTRRRLPGFLGDTLCQSRHRLRKYYAAYGFVLEREEVVETCLGFPRFLCHRLRRQ